MEIVLDTSARAATAVRGVLAALQQAHHAKDAAAIAARYAPGARIADLGPPLMRRGIDAAELQAWLDGWDAPVELTARDMEVEIDRDLAVCHGVEHTRTERAGDAVAWWCRATYVLARTEAGWRITHAHSSVPFYMDGSDRAAIDLEP
jgi:ketosteroid isomerase-like protein